MDANVRSNLSYLICLKHLNGSRAVTNVIFFPSQVRNGFLVTILYKYYEVYGKQKLEVKS